MRLEVACKWTLFKSQSLGGSLFLFEQHLENGLFLCYFFLRIKESGPCPWLAMWALTASRINLSTSPSARASASIFSASVHFHTLTHIQYMHNAHTHTETQAHTGCYCENTLHSLLMWHYMHAHLDSPLLLRSVWYYYSSPPTPAAVPFDQCLTLLITEH